jgi:hypothetical protein
MVFGLWPQDCALEIVEVCAGGLVQHRKQVVLLWQALRSLPLGGGGKRIHRPTTDWNSFRDHGQEIAVTHHLGDAGASRQRRYPAFDQLRARSSAAARSGMHHPGSRMS